MIVFINLATCMMFPSLQPGRLITISPAPPGAAHDLELQVGGSSCDSRPVDCKGRKTSNEVEF